VLIMITGYATILSAVEAIQKGAYDYLPKPFSPDQLRTVARRGLDHRNLKIETRRLREEKERMEKSFITFVSHEMRSPLVVIRQYIESLKAIAGDRFDKDVSDIIERCSKRIQGLEELIEHWLDLSRIEDGTFAQKKETLKLSRITARLAEEMAPVCADKGVSLNIDVPENLPEIVGDEESLVRVFANIIGNATKYTPAGGKITVSAQSDDCYVTVKVSDTGVGIPQDKLPYIFEPFFRVRGREEREKGSGLGLTFCKKIMTSHGGEIEASSKEGNGTTFLLKFPAQSSSAGTSSQRPS
jgi:two-component system sensor histidine kinase/response regulator